VTPEAGAADVARPGAVAALPAGITEAQARAHVIRPSHVTDVVADNAAERVLVEVPRKVFPAPPHLNVQKFTTAFHAHFKDQVAGYAMQLRKNGAPLETLIWNWADNPLDGGKGWNLDTRMHVASISKLITAMAMTKLLDDKNISYDAKIIGYLPAYWAKGPNIDKISFRNLMTHTSGFRANGATDYESMKSFVAAGVTNANYGVGSYENMNFGLCRVMMGIVEGTISKTDSFPAQMNDQVWDLFTIDAYAKYVQKTVLTPAGVTNATLGHANGMALAYMAPPANLQAGWNSGDLGSVSGAAGWHLSVNEVLNIMNTFRRKGTIMPNAKAQGMITNMFGLDEHVATPAGDLYNKNGRWTKYSPNGPTEQGVAYFLPDNMELVVFVNSMVGANQEFLRGAVDTLYLNNIE
jgi:CubicO group peptidase (beta-lactamase class C family)